MKRGKKRDKSVEEQEAFIEKGAVVLAKYRKDPPWPALVGNVDTKKKQAMVTWILSSSDHDSRTKFKMSFKRLLEFDPQMESSEPGLADAIKGAQKFLSLSMEERVSGQNSPDGIFARVKKSFPVKAKKRTATWEYRIPSDDVVENGSADLQNGSDMYTAVKSRKKEPKRKREDAASKEEAEPESSGLTDGEGRLASCLWEHEITSDTPTTTAIPAPTTSPHQTPQNCATDDASTDVKDPNLETEADDEENPSSKPNQPPNTQSSHTRPKRKDKAAPFTRGDVVWIKYGKWEWWPSIILNLQPNKKRVTFLYLALPSDSEAPISQRFSVGYKNVHKFKEFYHKHYTSSSNMELLAAIDQAEDIIRGTFDPFKSIREPQVTENKEKESNEVVERVVEEAEDSDDLAGKMDVEGDVEDEDSPQPFSPNTHSAIQDRKVKNRELMNLIVAEDTKVLLEKIYRKEIANERQDLWDSEPSMNPPTSFGPIMDEDQIEELVQILSLWFQTVNPDASVRNTFSYIICVWLPEAVKHGLCKKYQCGTEEAERMLGAEMMAACFSEEVDAVKNDVIAERRSDSLENVATSSGTAFEQLVAVACQEREKTKSPPPQAAYRLNCAM